VVTAAILVATGFVALLWRGAAWLDASRLRGLTPVQRQAAIDAIRGRLLQLGGGLVLASGLLVTLATYRLNQQGHVTHRYTKAIDQLGSTGLDVRLAAIYALERIMTDSGRDHPTIVEVPGMGRSLTCRGDSQHCRCCVRDRPVRRKHLPRVVHLAVYSCEVQQPCRTR